MDPVFIFLIVLLVLSLGKIFFLENILKGRIKNESNRLWIGRAFEIGILVILFAGLYWYFLGQVPIPD